MFQQNILIKRLTMDTYDPIQEVEQRESWNPSEDDSDFTEGSNE